MAELGLFYWITAWIVMALAFLSAAIAIIGGAHALDQNSNPVIDENPELEAATAVFEPDRK